MRLLTILPIVLVIAWSALPRDTSGARPSSVAVLAPGNPPAATQSTIVLYDGALDTGTPDTQGFDYLTLPLGGALATQTFTTPVTTLDTTPRMSDSAGYFATSSLYPPLDRNHSYQVLFTTQVVTESHLSKDRAGFSLLVTSSDKQGIELGFWTNQVWAQEGGTIKLFTHAEGAAFDTTTGLIDYRLAVLGDHYTLSANGLPVLSGNLRDYTAASLPPGNPYKTPNLIFLGDDTSAAQATIRFRAASVIDGPPVTVYVPLVVKG